MAATSHGEPPTGLARLELARGPALAIGIALTAGLCVVDYWTGPELSFSIFYFLPILLVTWSVGRAAGMAIAVLSAIAWLLAEVWGGQVYSQDWIEGWNTLTRLGVFMILALTLSSLKSALRAAHELARVDPLTGLANVRAFGEATERELLCARRDHNPLSVLYLDVDNFKTVNDQFGHSAGDELLVEIGRCLRAQLRGSDIAARLGGDEFAVLLPNTDAEQARSVVGRIEPALAQIPAESRYPIGFSIGVACFAEPPKSADALLHAADALMYQVKHGKKGEARIELL